MLKTFGRSVLLNPGLKVTGFLNYTLAKSLFVIEYESPNIIWRVDWPSLAFLFYLQKRRMDVILMLLGRLKMPRFLSFPVEKDQCTRKQHSFSYTVLGRPHCLLMTAPIRFFSMFFLFFLILVPF